MFLLSKPSENNIREFLLKQTGAPFSYTAVGATRGELPARYAVDHHRIQLGRGLELFAIAVKALHRWEMFRTGWVQLFDAATPIETGNTVVAAIQHFGFWSLNASRIVYTIEASGRNGFAYGTLMNHAESGEERFTVELVDGVEVWYDILAFSRPRHPLARAGYPLARLLQKRFAEDSQKAMWRAVNSPASMDRQPRP